MVSQRVQTLLNLLRSQGISDERVLAAIAAVPREKFIDEAFEHKAWENVALPIGQGQTISQPYMVARMTELLALTPGSRVLEIGTGSGYQTAILAHLVHHVCSVERIKSLQWHARRRLKQLDLHNVQELPHARIAILLQRLRAAVGDDLFVSHNIGVISNTQHFRHVVGNHHAGDAKGAVQLRN